MPNTTIRKAIVNAPTDPEAADRRLRQVAAYLPSNYSAVLRGDIIDITGTDVAGWTLDDYVIPRLASGLITAKEVEVIL